MRKKILSLGIATLMLAVAIGGCGAKDSGTEGDETTNAPTEQSNGGNDNTGGDATSGSYKTGLGVVTSIKSSKDATAEANGTVQVDSVIATVTVGSDGKIVKCSLDSAQTRIPITATGTIDTDKTAVMRSKMELGADYGMVKNSGIGKEWFEQAQAFADWTIGKTVDEVKGLTVKQVDESHPMVPDVPELASSVTITVGDYIDAIAKATANATTDFNGDSIKTGLGIYTKISSSKDATAEADGTGQVDSAIAAVTLDADGKILSCTIDAAQTRVGFSNAGVITADKAAQIKTKVELGADYGMLKNSAIGKEWFEQAKAFADWTVGKTISEVTSLTVKQVDESHPMVPDVPELTSTVTVSVGDYMEAIKKAVDNAQ